MQHPEKSVFQKKIQYYNKFREWVQVSLVNEKENILETFWKKKKLWSLKGVSPFLVLKFFFSYHGVLTIVLYPSSAEIWA